MLNLLKDLFREYALRTGKLRSAYVRTCNTDGEEFALFMKLHGGLHSVGNDVAINTGVNITDPAYVRIGNDCTVSDCTLLGHDGVVRVLNNATVRNSIQSAKSTFATIALWAWGTCYAGGHHWPQLCRGCGLCGYQRCASGNDCWWSARQSYRHNRRLGQTFIGENR